MKYLSERYFVPEFDKEPYIKILYYVEYQIYNTEKQYKREISRVVS